MNLGKNRSVMGKSDFLIASIPYKLNFSRYKICTLLKWLVLIDPNSELILLSSGVEVSSF